MSIWDYIHKYAPAKDKNDPVKYTNDMVNRFNQAIGSNVITKDTSLGELKESLIEAGLDPEHTITKAHLQTEDPRVLRDLNLPTGKAAVNREPMPAVRKSNVVEKKQEPKIANPAPKKDATVYNPNPTLGVPDIYPNAPKKQAPKVIVKPTPAVTKPSTPTKPLTRAEIDQRVKKTFNVDLTSEQLDIATNPKLTTEEKLIELGFIKPPKIVDDRKERGTITKIWDSLFGEDSVPLDVTIQAKKASSGEDLHEEKEVKNVASPLAPGAVKTTTPIQQPVKTPTTKKSIVPTQQPPIAVDNSKRKQDLDAFTSKKGFTKITDKLYRGKSYQNIDQGTYSRAMIDMSDGITVMYQPRNEKNSSRGDVDNALIVSDYLYDYDFTDNYEHGNALLQNTKLKEALFKPKDWDKRTYVNEKGQTVHFAPWRRNMFNVLEGRKFVTVRENLGGGKYKVKIKKIDDLTEADFNGNKIYRQGYSKLSDFDITPDQKKIKLFAKSDAFVGQGLPFRDENNKEHGLRVGGGKGKVSVNAKGQNVRGYLDIANLDEFGMYLGGTVTIISDDGKVAYKMTGSMKDIMETAFHIKEKTNSKEIYFLQSDSGSMNQKADAVNGKIKRGQLVITRNKDAWAGAAEILLNE